ncbi:MAG: TonB-dependent receptor [Flavobacteriales bacterium]|nr:TonB-dependent receptor [Flavobacteriales bacterium]
MIRISAAFFALAIACSAKAQLAVSVQDENSTGVPYAHVVWQVLNAPTKGVVVAGPEGKLTLPLDQSDVQGGVALRIDFIGYVPLLDTVYSMAPRSFRLKHAQLFDLDAVVVTGQYRPTTADKAVQRMHVIGAQQIQRMAAQNLGDVLGQELNMRLTQDNVLGTSLSMRGMGGQNVKILVDGVPVIGRQDGNLDLAQIDLTGIDRVEVLEGPLSVNYGTNALAGTINLITRKNTGNSSSFKAIGYVEPMGRLNLSVAAGQHFGKSDVLVSAGRNFFGGWAPGQSGLFSFKEHLADSTRYQPWKPREQYFGRLNYRYALTDRWTLNYKGEAMQDRIIDRGMPLAPYEERAFDSEFLTQRFDNALFATGKLNKGRHIDALIAHDRYQRTRSLSVRDLTTLEMQPVPGEADDSRFTLTNIRGTYANANDSAKLGYELGTDLNLETAAGERIADSTAQQIGDYAAFASAQWRPVQRLIIRPGLRYAYNTQYNAPIVPSIDARLQLDTAFTLRASYAEGFRAPSLKELYLYFVDVNHDIHGNPDLTAETSNNYSLSLNYRKAMEKGVLRGEIAGFHDRVHNLITLAEEGPTLYSYINVGEYRTLGGSFSLGWEAGHWSLNTGTAITGRYDTLGVRTGGTVYEYTPEVNLNATRNWRKQGWSITAFAKYQGEQQNYIYLDDGSLSRGRIASYVMADASVSKTLCKERLTVSVGCKNIGDITDLNATLGNGGAHSGPGAGSVPLATGRTFFLRMALDLKGKANTTTP